MPTVLPQKEKISRSLRESIQTCLLVDRRGKKGNQSISSLALNPAETGTERVFFWLSFFRFSFTTI